MNAQFVARYRLLRNAIIDSTRRNKKEEEQILHIGGAAVFAIPSLVLVRVFLEVSVMLLSFPLLVAMTPQRSFLFFARTDDDGAILDSYTQHHELYQASIATTLFLVLLVFGSVFLRFVTQTYV